MAEDNARRPGGVTYSPGFIARASYQAVQTIYRHLEEGMFPKSWKIGKRKWIIPHEDAVNYLGFDPEETKIEVKR